MGVSVYTNSAFNAAKQNILLISVYNRMMIGLFVSGMAAYIASESVAIQRFLFGNGIMVRVLFLAEIGLVFAIFRGIRFMSSSMAGTFFITGLTFGQQIIMVK